LSTNKQHILSAFMASAAQAQVESGTHANTPDVSAPSTAGAAAESLKRKKKRGKKAEQPALSVGGCLDSGTLLNLGV
jgi:hypothetical protein